MTKAAKHILGEKDGQELAVYTLTNQKGESASITNYGGIWLRQNVLDKNGQLSDVLLGIDETVNLYAAHPFFGVLVGRFANRIGDARFNLNGKEYTLAKNDGKNHLHGGTVGYDKMVWTAEIRTDDSGEYLHLSLLSPDGDEGYPGAVQVKVEYRFTDASELSIRYAATTTADTVINLTNHAYFNLSGHADGSILDHMMQIDADTITAIDGTLIPTGELASVAGTPFDFRTPKTIGAAMENEHLHEQLVYAGGLDHNFVLNTKGDLDKVAAIAKSPKTGRVMTVRTTKPGVQLYTGNFLKGDVVGKNGATYPKRSGFCLETQYFPDSPNKPQFPSCVLKPGEVYQHETIYTFSVEA